VDVVGVLGRIEAIYEYFHCGAIAELLQLVGALEEDAAGLYFVHLTDEGDVVVQPRIQGIAAQVEQGLRPELGRTILDQRLNQDLYQFLLLFQAHTLQNIETGELFIN